MNYLLSTYLSDAAKLTKKKSLPNPRNYETFRPYFGKECQGRLHVHLGLLSSCGHKRK